MSLVRRSLNYVIIGYTFKMYGNVRGAFKFLKISFIHDAIIYGQ